MCRFLKLSFLCSLILLSVFSCKTYQLERANTIPNSQKLVKNLYFSSKDDYVYKCQMEVYGHHISGILVIKKISEATHRVVMTTNFGNKMIDFEISNHDFKLHYVLADLNRKMVINFLRKDFQELLKWQYPVTKSYENSDSKIYLSKQDQKDYYLFFDKNSGLLKQIVYNYKGREKIDFTFGSKKHTFADYINLVHKDLKITIKLTQITQD